MMFLRSLPSSEDLRGISTAGHRGLCLANAAIVKVELRPKPSFRTTNQSLVRLEECFPGRGGDFPPSWGIASLSLRIHFH
jgi:hypothetical protein